MEIRDLADGVYEKVISKDFLEKLRAAGEGIWTERETPDSQEAVGYLSDYLAKLVRISLKAIADEDSEGGSGLPEEIALTNRLIEKLTEQVQALGAGHAVTETDFLLRSLESRRNKTAQTKWTLPETSLSRSFLFTNSQKDVSIAHELAKEIQSSDRIDLLVSFIRYSGLMMIYNDLKAFTNRGGKLRVITTTYMGATQPKAIQKLAELSNTEIKISYNVKSTRLHAKAYMFQRESGYSTAYVGSSNLSHAAIADGMEWNVKVTEQDMPTMMSKMRATFETYWNHEEFETYRPADYEKLQTAVNLENHKSVKEGAHYAFEVRPYPFQETILEALHTERESKNRYRNLVVAATGTGKTAIAAFDYRNLRAEKKDARLLFIAHREEILKQSRDCFRQVLRDGNFGELAVGSHRAAHPEHLFMSIQTLNSSRFCEKMDPDYYDMIIVDEFHHAAAASYQKLLQYFQPKILLGLTATPERMDGGDILQYFGGHIAAEIRLPDAIERRLLCPFHYFGVADPIDLSSVKWTKGQYDVKELNAIYTGNGVLAKQRAQAILRALDDYTADMEDVKAIGFCVSQAHAHYMADYFNGNGMAAMALDAHSPDADRISARQRLERGELKVIFTVDLFNEGVDIPSVDTVLFLRPTNSMTVFLQQLGRGLRLSEGKDALTVLDFVAQANKRYNFAARYEGLLGKKGVSIKKEIESGFPHVPKGCFIHLEEQAQEHILKNIKASIGQDRFYIEMVQELSEVLGQVPTLTEFLKAIGTEAQAFYNGKRTYTRLLAQAELRPDFPDTEEEFCIQKAMPRFLSMDSPKWIAFIKDCYEAGRQPQTEIERKYLRMWAITLFPDTGKLALSDSAEAILRFENKPEWRQEILEFLDYQYEAIDTRPCAANLVYPCAMEVYCHYTRDQIFAALGFAKPSSIREGVKYLDAKNSDIVTRPTDVFLVTLNKSEKDFSDTTLYEDYSISKDLFHWQSQSTTTPESKTGQRYIEQREKGNYVLLFVRSAKKDAFRNAQSYTFLGKATISSWSGSQPMSIVYRLENPIPAKYIQMTDSSGVL